MESYNSWQDLFDTYQSLPDWMKLAWLVVPPAFVLGLLALLLRYRLAGKRAAGANDGTLAYTIHSDGKGGFFVHAHDSAHRDSAGALSAPASEARVLPLPGARSELTRM